MKECPTCGAAYGDDMSFCLADGTPLGGFSASDPKTEEFVAGTGPGVPTNAGSYRQTSSIPSVPTIYPGTGKRSSGVLPVVIIILVVFGGLTILSAAGAAGYWYYAYSRANELDDTPPYTPQNTSENTGSSDQIGNSDPGNLDGSPDNRVIEKPSTPTPFPTSKPGPSPSPVKETTDKPKPKPDNSTTGTDIAETDSDPKRGPRRISGGVLNGKAISLPKPPYPPAARAVRAGGIVTVQVLVDENGQVISASAVSGHPLLRGAAAAAARQARFSPTKLLGKPVRVSGVITYNFVPPPAS